MSAQVPMSEGRPVGACIFLPAEGCAVATVGSSVDGKLCLADQGADAVVACCRHPNDELNYCYYLIPCGKPGYCGDVTESDLARLHNDAITKVGID